MLPLQLVLRPERAESAWPSPPRPHARKRRNSAFSLIPRALNPRCRTPLVLCPAQLSYRSPPTPKTFSRRRSRHLTIHHSARMVDSSRLLDLPHVLIHYCATVIEAVVSTTTAIVHSVFDTASTMLQNWWSGGQEDDISTLEVAERQPHELQGIHDILEENNQLKRLLEFAMTSHVIMNEATVMLEDGADLWMKRAEDVVDAKVHEAEQERDVFVLQLEELQDQLGDKDQVIERLRDSFVWVTENLNDKEDEICELHERLERYEALLKVLDADKVV